MKPSNSHPASILITDDESNIRLMLRTALESEGYHVQEACNGLEALDAIQRRTPDLMVLDLNMPALDGMAVLEQMKTMAQKMRPRVIVLTAYGSIPAAVRATRLGALDFLEKPITPGDLRQTVRSVLEEPELDDPPCIEQAQEQAYAAVLDRVRRALRLADLATAESMLARAADLCGQKSADYLNLVGVLYESQRRWRLARKFYGKALEAGGNGFDPARQNLLRLNELHRYGKTAWPISLGDEDNVLYAHLPQ